MSLAAEVEEWKQKLLQESTKSTKQVEKFKQQVEKYKPHNVYAEEGKEKKRKFVVKQKELKS